MLQTVQVPEMPELQFVDRTHTYLLDGAEIPSVSAVMEPLSRHEYGRIDEQTLSRAASRGTAVHNSIENYIKYGVEDIDEELRGYMDGFLEWWKWTKPEVAGSEIRVYHKLLRYGGTIDLLARIDGKLTLVDYKTTYKLVSKNCRVQLEAYAQALASHGIHVEKKHILHLGKDGRWDNPEFKAKDGLAWGVFGSLKSVYDYLEME